MNCENCLWFSPSKDGDCDPHGHKSELISWLRAKGQHILPVGWPGKCSLNPAQVDTTSTRTCGSWKIDDDFLETINERLRQYEGWGEELRLRGELSAERKRSRERYRKLKELKAAR